MIISQALLVLSSYRWNVPVVARLGDEEGSFNDLARDLDVSRDSLSRTLGALTDPGWVTTRPGARKLYCLTPRGRPLAPPCAEIVETARRLSLEAVLFRKWSLPVAAALRGWSLGFAELRAVLGEITPRALTLALKEMQAFGLVERTVIGGFPPSTSYRLAEVGERLLPSLARVARIDGPAGAAHPPKRRTDRTDLK